MVEHVNRDLVLLCGNIQLLNRAVESHLHEQLVHMHSVLWMNLELVLGFLHDLVVQVAMACKKNPENQKATGCPCIGQKRVSPANHEKNGLSERDRHLCVEEACCPGPARNDGTSRSRRFTSCRGAIDSEGISPMPGLQLRDILLHGVVRRLSAGCDPGPSEERGGLVVVVGNVGVLVRHEDPSFSANLHMNRLHFSMI